MASLGRTDSLCFFFASTLRRLDRASEISISGFRPPDGLEELGGVGVGVVGGVWAADEEGDEGEDSLGEVEA